MKKIRPFPINTPKQAKPASPLPELRIYPHYCADLTKEELNWLLKTTQTFLESLFLEYPKKELFTLKSIDISLIDNEAIITPHLQFFNDESPTDVITFPHGEILISTEMAQMRAKEYNLTTAPETLQYIIHGFLHLVGYNDLEETELKQMHRIQENKLRVILNKTPPP